MALVQPFDTLDQSDEYKQLLSQFQEKIETRQAEALLLCQKMKMVEEAVVLSLAIGRIDDAVACVNRLIVSNPSIDLVFPLLEKIVTKYVDSNEYEEALKFIQDQTEKRSLCSTHIIPLLQVITDSAKAKDKLPEVEALRRQYGL